MDTSTQSADTNTADSNRESQLLSITTAGAGLIFLTGLIHLGLATEQLEEATYLGVLFAANFASATVAAIGIYRNRRWGWWLGAAIAVVAIIAYVAHGTVGLPMVGSEELLEPAGVVAKLVELLYLGVAAVGMRNT